jgi:peptidoglycan/LPS O-acetylase OafA/YrhL
VSLLPLTRERVRPDPAAPATAAAPAPAGRRRIELSRLTSLRAFAALAVFAYHLHTHTDWLNHGRYARYGFAGVGFFFVLSGFVLTWSMRPGERPSAFYVRRFARIYPSYLVLALVALVVPVTVFAASATGATANLLLVQSWFRAHDVVFSLNGVSWSLSCEAFFYLVAPFLIGWLALRSRRTAVLACLTWVVLTAAVAVSLGVTSDQLDTVGYTNPAIRSGEFVLGVLLATLVRSGWRPRFRLSVAMALLVVAGLVLSRPLVTLPMSVVDVLLAPVVAFVILAAALADLGPRRGWLGHPGLVYLGQVSFAFYLVHELVIINLVTLVGPYVGLVGGVAMAGGTFVVALVLAVGLHELVELPAQRAVLRVWANRGARRSVTLAAG